MDKLKPLIVFFIVLIVASCAPVSRNTKPAVPDPTYKGKTASQWATEFALQDQEVGSSYIEERHLFNEPVGHAAREALDKILGKSTEDSNEK